MARDYIPRTDAGVLAFTANFLAVASASYEALALTQAMMEEYATLHATYAAALRDATNPETRGLRTVFLKNEARKSLVAVTRRYCQQISKLIGVSDAQRQSLGITIAGGRRAVVPPPEEKPEVFVERVDGRSVTLGVRRTDGTCGRPANAASATVVIVRDDGTFQFAANTTRSRVVIAFPPSAIGDTVAISAFWSNARQQHGPMATPVRANLPAGGVISPTTASTPTLRAA